MNLPVGEPGSYRYRINIRQRIRFNPQPESNRIATAKGFSLFRLNKFRNGNRGYGRDRRLADPRFFITAADREQYQYRKKINRKPHCESGLERHQ
jgi:hypothetical protein